MDGKEKEKLKLLLSCQICEAICKRAVSVKCCGAKACRNCATKKVTTNRTCWNNACLSPTNTDDLVNDDNMRVACQNFNINKPVPADIVAKNEAASKSLQDNKKNDAKPSDDKKIQESKQNLQQQTKPQEQTKPQQQTPQQQNKFQQNKFQQSPQKGQNQQQKQTGHKCGMCEVIMLSENEIDQHYTGKKHFKRQFQDLSRQKEEGKGVFVTSLGNLPISSIQAYFAQWGTISNIFVHMDKKNEKKICSLIMEFEQAESVARILDRRNMPNHNVPYGDPARPRIQKLKVFPRIVKPARPRSPSPPLPPQIPFSEIKLKVALSSDLEEQMMEIMSMTELTEEDIEERYSICENIRKTFARDGHPHCVVSPFGSTVNGLGFRGCDVDIYLDFGDKKEPPLEANVVSPPVKVDPNLSESGQENCDTGQSSGNDDDKESNVAAKIEESSRIVNNQNTKEKQPNKSGKKFGGKFEPGGSEEKEILEQQNKVRLSAKLLRSIPYCSRIHPIPQARVPIVKFIHSKTGINCDISFKNKCSVFNSYYIRFCTDQDSRIKPLMMAIRLIFKWYEIGGGGGGAKMSNYALTILIIFYLQQMDRPLLHPVSVLQNFTEPDPERTIDGWNFSFCTDISKLPSLPVNKQGLFDLFAGFFQYYSTLDFTSTFISPYLGRLVTRLEMKTKLPEEYQNVQDFQSDEVYYDRLMSVQDPFELSFNVCRNLPERGLVRIICVLKSVHHTCTQLKENPRPGGFNHLMDLKILPDESVQLPNPMQVFESQDVEMAFCLPLLKKPSAKDEEKEVAGNKDEQSESDDAELLAANELITQIFSEVFLFTKWTESDQPDKANEAHATENEDTKKRKSSNSTEISVEKKARLDITAEEEQRKSVTGDWSVYHHVWNGRKKYQQELDQEDIPLLEKEAMMTRKLVEKEGSLGNLPPEVVFRHHINKYKGHVCLGLEKIKSRKKIYENLFTWLRSYLPDLIKKL